jgi:hypothetical protein
MELVFHISEDGSEIEFHISEDVSEINQIKQTNDFKHVFFQIPRNYWDDKTGQTRWFYNIERSSVYRCSWTDEEGL